MYEQILVATDGSETASRAADHALDLAQSVGATIHALVVIPSGASKRDQTRSNPQQDAQALLDSIEADAERLGVPLSTESRSGDPCETIVDYADQRDVDLIIMGSTSAGRLGRLLQGSTTQCVLENGSVPVLSVGDGSETAAGVDDEAAHRFACPECGSVLQVDDATREALLDGGCVVCGATVTDEAFN